jgi:hypothetical protein
VHLLTEENTEIILYNAANLLLFLVNLGTGFNLDDKAEKKSLYDVGLERNVLV